MHAFHISISINLWQPPYKDGEIIFSLLIEVDVYKISTVKTEKKVRGNKMKPTTMLIHVREVMFSVQSGIKHTTLSKQSRIETYFLAQVFP